MSGTGPLSPLPVVDAEAEAVGAATFVLSLRARGIREVGVLRAMELVPREVFAPRRFADLARSDVALPLPCGQTMTAPGTVAGMLVALGVESGQRVLEIGTGSGYVSALLARLGAEVVTVERYAALGESAAQHWRVAGVEGIVGHVADGLAGHERPGPQARFDRILLNGAVPSIPDAVIGQLAPSGRLVGALSGEGRPRLVRLDRDADGAVRQETGAGVRISPLVPGVSQFL
ncbi:MAG TPA: methyltransferase domain-containing protein [Microvirga sp.]|jgi:protein-L-isoaspartate(D-aspartate) O-methyltransferase|nr:methyltransferase domain-containing protein [Microvirga sp.]